MSARPRALRAARRLRWAAACVTASSLACAFGANGCHGRAPPSGMAPSASASSALGEPEREPAPSRPHVAEINLSAGLPELLSRRLLRSPRHRSFVELVETIHQLTQPAEQRRVKGLMVRFGSASMGISRAQELADLLASVRSSGIPVVCHADDLSNASYWVAAAGCDHLWVSPAGGVDTTGIAAQLLYARRLLGELKVDVDMLQVGKFKGASEPFTREGPSDEARESLMGVLHSLRRSWLDGVSKHRSARGLSPESLEAGPYSPEEARGRGMIDAIGYPDEAADEAKHRAGVDQVVVRFGPSARGQETSNLVGLVRAVSGVAGGHGGPHVALVRAVGAISMGGSSSLLDEGEGISQRHLSHTLEKLRRDEAVRVVVLRIDSPGGSALASDLLWRALMDLRSVKPLVVSIGDMAASGGYYMACTGSRIVAQPTSIVGSIGVVGGKLSIGRGLEHIGVHAELFPAADAAAAQARAAYMSPFESWDAATRDRVFATMKSVYDLFVRRVAEGRGIGADRVGAVAEGRIFAGADAVGLGLVDELGGVQTAIGVARSLVGLGPEAPVLVVGEEGGLTHLLEMDDDDVDDQAHAELSADSAFRSVAMRMSPEIVAFARGFEPLAMGEHTLTAVPFAFVVR